MFRKILFWGFLSLFCCNLFGQFNNTDEYKKVRSNKPAYLKKAEKKIRKSKCYRYLKKKYPSIANGKMQIIYSLDLKKKLTHEEFTYPNIMDNLEFRYWNNRKFPDNHVYLYDATSNVIFSYEEGYGLFCYYDGSGLKEEIISHVTIDNVQPDIVFMSNISIMLYFLVKGDEIYVLPIGKKLMTLNDFVENHYDEYVK